MSIVPHLLFADAAGNILDDPDLLMLGSRGGEWFLPTDGELEPLPPESDLFLLPGRKAIGFNLATGRPQSVDGLAVAAFAAPGHTLDAHPAFLPEKGAPMLPLFAYGAVGFAKNRFWICARKVDDDPRQRFAGISEKTIERNCRQLLKDHPQNRLVGHIINNCCRRYNCPAARNFALGRYEAPIPTSRACNARCLGCISAREADSPIRATPQCRLEFTPTCQEIVGVMAIHEKREKRVPVYSFGQGCEGDPLLNAQLLADSITRFRALRANSSSGNGTVNCNTNASRPEAVEPLAKAGLTSLRVSLNSARPDLYAAYYRPLDYDFDKVRQSIRLAARHGVFVSLNYLYFPGVSDTRDELEALANLCGENGISMIQWRNLNIDPAWYATEMGKVAKTAGQPTERAMGLNMFMKKLKKACPWLRYGYFNPYLGNRATPEAPIKKLDGGSKDRL